MKRINKPLGASQLGVSAANVLGMEEFKWGDSISSSDKGNSMSKDASRAPIIARDISSN